MWEKMLLETDVYHIINWFLVYSILGWVVESIYMSFCNKKWTNRGFIHGPICPIYGVGALTVFFLLRPFSGNYFVLYFCGMVLATTLEYITGIVMQKIFGCIWWDYNDKPFNYKGILCLESSIAWGFYTVFLFWFLQRGVEGIVNLYPRKIGKILASFLLLYYAVDFAISMIGAIDLNEKLRKLNRIVEEIQERLKKINIHRTKKWIKEHLENRSLSAVDDNQIVDLSEKYQKLRFHPNVLSKHFINAYQAFRVWSRKLMEREEKETEEEKKEEGILEGEVINKNHL